MSESGDDALKKLELYKTRRENTFAQLQATFDVSKSAGATSVNSFLARCSELSKIKERFEECQDAIMALNTSVKADDRLSVSAQTLSFDQIYYEIKATEETFKHRMGRDPEVSPSVRLPKIVVPNWAGDLNTFANFFALFNESVHKGPYSLVTKFTYLRSLLSGPPLKLIETLELSDANYLTAYRLLQNRYASTRTLATHYLTKITDFRPLISESRVELQGFLDTFDTSYQAFSNLNLENHGDFVMFHLALRCLPPSLKLLFERSLGETNELPSFVQLISFVREQCKIQERVNFSYSKSPNKGLQRASPQNKFSISSPSALLVTPTSSKPSSKNAKVKCALCESSHSIYTCERFKALPVNERYEFVKRAHRCFACLGTHLKVDCKSASACQKCKSSKHHTLLHNDSVQFSSSSGTVVNSNLPQKTSLKSFEESRFPQSKVSVNDLNTSSSSFNSCLENSFGQSTNELVSKTSEQVVTPATAKVTIASQAQRNALLTKVPSEFESYATTEVLLGTARCLIKDRWGRWCPIRVVIDPGSQINLVTNACVQRLGLPIHRQFTRLTGIMKSAVGTSSGTVSCSLKPLLGNGPEWCVQASTLPKICSDLPTVSVSHSISTKFAEMNLADPEFHLKAPVDFLLGASLYPEILSNDFSIIHGKPAALQTVFGWVLMGAIPSSPALIEDGAVSLCTQQEPLQEQVERFWKTEEVDCVNPVKPEHCEVEQHFAETHKRVSSGAYVVRLPFNSEFTRQPFGDSRATAVKRWCQHERKLRFDEPRRTAYHDFLQQYLELGHMRLSDEPGLYYIPHFAVERDSLTSPVRVVFDASCPDSSGISLNDRLLAGPPLQKDIGEILTRFRLKPIAISADIKMMYRQIWTHPEDVKYQHILWRKNEDAPLLDYTLLTLTYGLTSSPFLAQRVLLQLIQDHGANFVLASEAISRTCFMDDICTSVSSLGEATQMKQELNSLLHLGGFQLRKWASNSAALLHDIPPEHQAGILTLHPDESKPIHILGLEWNPKRDVFTYKITLKTEARTKRAILSQVASIFDPLGWVAPVVFKAKAFLQELWTSGLDWDTPLPKNLLSRWAEFASELHVLGGLEIPRLCVPEHTLKFQLIGMCDASQLGFAALVYLRCEINKAGEGQLFLLKSKSKVAPLKVQTIPRLELNGALLLAKLVKSQSYLLDALQIQRTILFTDSQVVLAWLRTPPYRLKTYVANRVVQVLESTTISQWEHIPTNYNSADIASRGLMPSRIRQNDLWWNGPSFLKEPQSQWGNYLSSFNEYLKVPDIIETKPISLALTKAVPNSIILELIEKVSSLTKLKRTVAWILRFVSNAKLPPTERLKGTLTTKELNVALRTCVRHTQIFYFPEELKALHQGKPVKTSLASLSPYLDEMGVLKVGGRLRNSSLPETAKHPTLLPAKAPLSLRICDYFHLYLLHGGPRTTQAMIQTCFWIPSLRSLIRKRIHNCIVCFKLKAQPQYPLMGDLPTDRVNPNRVFLNTGVDMAGPFKIKESQRRNSQVLKGYICLFVCMAVKAVHIEVVSDMSTAAYRGALDRFIARRGLCKKMYCDQGSNFVGASNEDKELLRFLKTTEPEIADYLSTKQIEYRFNPPEAPWMGGLWEAAVKSAKHHLLRCAQNHALTFEKFTTLICRIEAVLNSRPLCQNSIDPENSGDFLSPGHFLIGAPLLSPPETDLLDVPDNRVHHWQLVQRSVQQFWRRWSTEYLHTIIQRQKWQDQTRPLKLDEPVLILRTDTKPLDWPLGRIVQLFSGQDGVVRSAKVRTNHGIYHRPAAKLIPLPLT